MVRNTWSSSASSGAGDVAAGPDVGDRSFPPSHVSRASCFSSLTPMFRAFSSQKASFSSVTTDRKARIWHAVM
jgi:hypothetical protein